jgi:hypothetical protein
MVQKNTFLGLYILNADHTTEPVDDLMEWAKRFERNNRTVARTELPFGVWVSTVFLGVDHAYNDTFKPLIFETMIFGGPYDETQKRYSTWGEAERGHYTCVTACKRVPFWKASGYWMFEHLRIIKNRLHSFLKTVYAKGTQPWVRFYGHIKYRSRRW